MAQYTNTGIAQMKIAVIGSGNVCSNLANLFVLAHHQVVLGSRDANKAKEIAEPLGKNASGTTYAEAVIDADVIVIATPWSNNVTKDVIVELGDLSGKIVIDCTNPLVPDYMSNTLGHPISSAEEIAKLIPGAKIVKAFNTIFAEVMAPGKQTFGEHKGTGFYCGDYPEAKDVVAKLIQDAGFEPVDAGVLKNARYLEAMGQLNIQIAYGLRGGTDVGFRYMRR
ncbi:MULTISPECIES: NADPH-dependent F420 reductase [Kamptonema]|uniref:NADPH-dependent F420 reductase n=1 Tax=Kamptonema TaxID=1501433 RepID=UPI0022771261|nr:MULTISPECIES: NADPH-dependent F420 reductase [Kamptonema]